MLSTICRMSWRNWLHSGFAHGAAWSMRSIQSSISFACRMTLRRRRHLLLMSRFMRMTSVSAHESSQASSFLREVGIGACWRRPWGNITRGQKRLVMTAFPSGLGPMPW